MKMFIWFILAYLCSPFSALSAASLAKSTEKRAVSLLEEALPVTDVQSVIMGYLDSWENQLKVTKKHKSGISALAYSANGKYIASGSVTAESTDGDVKLWYPQRNRWQARKTLQIHQFKVTALALSRDGEFLASAGFSNASSYGRSSLVAHIRIINLKNNKCEVHQVIRAHKSKISSLAFSPDGSYMVSGSLDKTIKIWHYKNKKYQLVQEITEQNGVSAVIFFAEGKNIISGCQNGTVKIWQYNQESKQFECAQNIPHNACANNPLAMPVVTDSTDIAACIMHSHNKYKSDSLNKKERWSVHNITSSFDETRLAIGSCEGLIELWDYRDKKYVCAQKIDNHVQAPMAFSFDNNYFAVGEGDKINIYKLNQHKQYEYIYTITYSVENHVDSRHVTAILFSPDSTLLICGLSDGSIEMRKNQALELYAHSQAEKSQK